MILLPIRFSHPPVVGAGPYSSMLHQACMDCRCLAQCSDAKGQHACQTFKEVIAYAKSGGAPPKECLHLCVCKLHNASNSRYKRCVSYWDEGPASLTLETEYSSIPRMQATRRLSNLRKPFVQGMILYPYPFYMDNHFLPFHYTFFGCASEVAALAGMPLSAKPLQSQNQLQRSTQLRRIGSVMYRVGKSSTGSHSLQRTETPRRILKPAVALALKAGLPSRPQVRHAGMSLARHGEGRQPRVRLT